MGAIESIWFVFWRMALRVFVLLTVLGTTYGVLVGGLTFPYGIGLMISGPIFGAIAGLGLGVLEGLVLGVVAVLVHRGGAPGDFLRYRRMAELACVVTCILAVALFWGVTFWRGPDPAASVRLAFTRDLPEALIIVVGPLLLATGATWVAARRVAGQYAREIAAGSPLEER
jgi:hypothetical protein